MDEINSTINDFGVKETILQRNMMDFYAREKGIDNYTSPKDIGELLCNIYIVISQSSNQIFELMKNQIFKNMIPRYLGDEYIVKIVKLIIELIEE